MPSVILAVADGRHNSRGFPGSQNRDNLIWFGMPEVRQDKLIPTTLRSFQNRNIPLLRPVRYPVAELIGNVGEDSPADRELVPIETEESDCPLRLLERLDQPIEQNPVEAAIAESDIICVVLAECVHGILLCGQIPGA